MDIDEWVDIKRDVDFYRTSDLGSFEYAVMKSIDNNGPLKSDEILRLIKPFITKPKTASEELEEKKLLSFITSTLDGLKDRKLVSMSKGSWELVPVDYKEDRKRLLDLYSNLGS